MADSVALGKVGVLGLYISAQVHALVGHGAGAYMGKGANLVVGAQMAVIALAGVHGGTGLNNGVLQ